jgi:Lar family restriction alleviation protein
MQMTDELKSCPFCGNDSKDEFLISFEYRTIGGDPATAHKVFNVYCSCGSAGPDGDTRKEAVERWNRRNDRIN